MSNIDKYNGVFCEIFQVAVENFVDTWDSVFQLSLVTQMEDVFDVMLEPEDVMDFKSYNLGKEILAKYGIEF